jgi:hypothetical protein
MNFGSHMFVLQENKDTIHELNQKNFENTQINLGRLQPCDERRMAWACVYVKVGYGGCVAPANSTSSDRERGRGGRARGEGAG